jgi:hypothetical protein
MVDNLEEDVKKETKPVEEVFDRISGLTKMRTIMIIALIGIAILLMFVGTTIRSTSDTSDTIKAGVVVNNLGVATLGGTLVLGAFNEKLDTNVKMGMLIAAGVIVGIGFI